MDNSERKEELKQDLDEAVDNWRDEFYSGAKNIAERTKAVIKADRKLDRLEGK